MELHVLDGHDRAGAVLRIAQELVDQLALLLVAALQHALDHARGQLLKEVHRVVDEHVVDQLDGLGIVHGLHDAGALVVVHVGKDLRGDVLRQQPEHHQHLFVVQRLQIFRNVNFVEHIERAAQLGLLAARKQRVQTGFDAIEIHWLHPPFQFVFPDWNQLCVPHRKAAKTCRKRMPCSKNAHNKSPLGRTRLSV